MIRFVASDLDGTLLQENGMLPPETFSVIHKLKENNIIFCAASGRQYANLRRLFAPVADDICYICENGSYVVSGEFRQCSVIPAHIAADVIRDILDSGMQLLLSIPESSLLLDTADRFFTDDIIYRLKNTSTIITDHSMYLDRFIKISGFHPNGIESIAPTLIQKWSKYLHADIAGHKWLDFTCTNKADGIRILSEEMGIASENMAAFGDQFNDLAMLKAVGHPFLMESAPEELKSNPFCKCNDVICELKSIIGIK